MGEKAIKAKEWATTPKITPASLIIFVIGFIIFLFFETDFFDSLSSIWKIIIYVGVFITLIILGVSLVDVKQLLSELRAIAIDSSMSAIEKVNAFMSIVVKAALSAGQQWELINEEQFSDCMIPEPQTNEEKIALAKKLIDEVNENDSKNES